MDTNKIAISVIKEYMEEHLFEPKSDWPQYYFLERSYSRWVALEIMNRIKTRSDMSPIRIIRNFIIEMDLFSEYITKREFQDIFSIAREAAKDILYLFL